MSNFEIECYNAYALGYFHGRQQGCDTNDYENEAHLRHLYSQGYNQGISDFCKIDLKEDADWVPGY